MQYVYNQHLINHLRVHHHRLNEYYKQLHFVYLICIAHMYTYQV